MARTNIELKARDHDPEATHGRCIAFGAVDQGLLLQRDTYFAARRGRLKLRQDPAAGAELIAYRREDSSAARGSTYVRAPVASPRELADALEAALGMVVVVEKRRRLLLWQGVRIHLDNVSELGRFIEFEAVLPDAGDLATVNEKLERFRTELMIEDRDLISVSYADLLMDGPEALLRAADTAMRNAYAPYSKFPVGAAVRAPSGAIYTGANVENVAFPVGWCAEASALGAAITAGETAITAVAVVSEKLEYCPPCGGCRQRLAEFGGPEVPVYLGRPGADIQRTTVGELLPGSFGKSALDG